MEPQLSPSHLKQTKTWVSHLSYIPLDENDDIKKNLIRADSDEDGTGPRETPKVALRKRFSWLHPLVHLLPVGATLGILQLTFREVYWDDDASFDVRWQAVLQFPAKLHEILVVGSLSAIVLHIFRRMLVSTNGIPLGLMVGAFQMGSAEYLISKSYVKPFRHSLMHRQYKIFFVALALGLSILYSFLVGPASAGALIPIRAWWHMRTPFNSSLLRTTYMSRSNDELYPLALGKDSIDPICLGPQEGWDSPGCPIEGWRVFSDWAWMRVQERNRYNVVEGEQHNPTMASSYSGQAQREIVTRLVPSSENPETAAALTATLHSSVLALADAFWHYISINPVGKINKTKRPKFIVSRKTPVSIPVVQVQCISYDYEDARSGRVGPYLKFNTNAMDELSPSQENVYSTAEWVVPDNTWDVDRDLDITKITWVDSSEIKGSENEPLPASLGAVVTVPIEYSRTLNGTRAYRQASLTTPCIIDARWATTEVMFDTAEQILTTGITDWLDTSEPSGPVSVKAALSGRSVTGPISLSAEWANALNSPILNEEEDSKFFGLHLTENFLQNFVKTRKLKNGKVLRNFVPSGMTTYKNASNEIAILLGSVLTDWISRSTFLGTNFTARLSAEEDGTVSTVDLAHQRSTAGFGVMPLAAFEEQTPVTFEVQRYGWGYGLGSDNAIWFSVITLLIHVLLVVAYFTYSFVFWCSNRGWTSNAWGTVGELVALAVTSPPANELRNSGAGINRSRAWMTRLRIREGSENPDKLELVVGVRNGNVVPTDNMVQIGKKYA